MFFYRFRQGLSLRCKVETSDERSRVNPSRGGGDIGTADRQTDTHKKKDALKF